ncbi:MAG: glycosyltransferase family 1 protein [Acholeplasmataceae bacterium]|nr:glycosyltransferase family 1 protein [Acholeplasmataceae bacterium]
MIRVLHIVGAMHRGGQETLIMNLFRQIDRKKVQFDFIVHTTKKMDYDDEILNLGGIIHRVCRKKISFIKNLLQIRNIVKKNRYIIVHRHGDNSFFISVDLFAAKIGGAKELISHSHNTSTKAKFLHKLFRKFNNKISNHKFACGNDAGQWMYRNNNFTIIKNGIDLKFFEYKLKYREEIRSELDIESNRFVICHVGRFNEQKNHIFIIDIFAELLKTLPKAILLLIGDGELRNQIERKIKHLGIEKNIYLLGKRNDINKILMGSDLFLFPSLFEGLPVSLIEAQASGITIVMSSVITDEVIISRNVEKISLSQDNLFWVKQIVNYSTLKRKGIEFNNHLKEYDSEAISINLQNFYLNLNGNDLC